MASILVCNLNAIIQYETACTVPFILYNCIGKKDSTASEIHYLIHKTTSSA